MPGLWLLGLAISTTWFMVDFFPRFRFVLLNLVAAAAVTMWLVWYGLISPLLALILLVVLLVSVWPTLYSKFWVLLTALIVVPIISVLLVLSFIPGAERFVASNGISFNIVKGLVAIPLLFLLYRCQQSMHWPNNYPASPYYGWLSIPLLVGVMLGFGWLSGLGWALQLEQSAWWFFASNLLFTVVAEEVLFRGLILAGLWYCVKEYTSNAFWVALVFSSVLFGVVHLGGGWSYAMMATVAGMIYGIAFYITGKLSGAIMAHIGVNMGHYTLLQYPY